MITESVSAIERVRQRLKDAIASGEERAIEKAQKAVERAEAAEAKVDADLVPPKRRGQSAARMRALRRIPRKGSAPAAPETFSQAFGTIFKDWFAGDSWGVWLVVAKSIFAEPLTAEELELFTKHTGRTVAQDTPAHEVWLACGRRAGKDYFVAALCVWLACRRKYTFSTGELGRIMLLAVDSDQADVLYSYITELVDSVPEFHKMVTGRSVKFGMRRVQFSNKVEILIKPADKRRVRGRTLVAVVADEIAHWFSEEHHQNPDVEVLGAVRPGMLGVPGAMLIAISSPYRRAGELFKTDQREWGKNGSPILFWRAATWEMRPNTPSHRARYPTFIAPPARARVAKGRNWPHVVARHPGDAGPVDRARRAGGVA